LPFPTYADPVTLRVDLHEIVEMPQYSLSRIEDRVSFPIRIMGPIDDYYDEDPFVFKSDQVVQYGDDFIIGDWDVKEMFRD